LRRAPAGVASADADAEVIARFRERMDDDLDTPSAMALLFDTVRRANAALDADDPAAPGLVAAGARDVHGDRTRTERRGDVPAEVAARAAALDEARVAKDYATADAIRAELQAAGGRSRPPRPARRCGADEGPTSSARQRRHRRHVDVAADLHRGLDERFGGPRLQAVAVPDDADLTIEVGVEAANRDLGVGIDRSTVNSGTIATPNPIATRR
jgi:hypothetical protein